jgi:TP901 family phage tail tape measure protein
MANTQAKIEITADTARLPAGLQRAKKMFQGFAETVGGGTRDILAGIGKGVLLGTGMTIANRGIDLMIEQGKAVIDFQRELTRLGIDLRKQPAEMQGIGLAMRQISNETGIGAEKVLAAGRAYADLAGAEAFTMDKMRLIARSAQASGTDVSDMAALMFTLTENMKVPDNQLEDTIGGLINQAKDGSIHFKELAKELVALGSVYSQFGVTGREGAIQIGAQMQLARHGFASASEAATGILRIYRSLPQHASKFRQAGVDIWMPGSKTKLRPFEDIIHQIQRSKLALDRELLIKSFGRTEGERFYQILTALTAQYDQLKQAGEANGVVQKDLATYTESAAGRIDVAMERVKNSFAEALTPERIDQIVQGIESIAAAMPAITSAIETAMDAFSGMIHIVRSTKDWYGGMAGYKYTPQELQSVTRGLPGHERIQDKAIGYEETMRDILSKESATGTTDAAVEAAIRNSSRTGVMTPGQEGAKQAAQVYLQDRNIAPYVIDRVRGKMEKERLKVINEHLDEEKKRTASGTSDVGGMTVSYAGPQQLAHEQMAKAVRDGVEAAMRSGFFGRPPSFDLRVDGAPLPTVVGNSRENRRR